MIGKDIEQFKNKYKDLDNCKFFGHLEGKSLLGHYISSDILCSPATENESFGIVLIEAMASKTAVLASNINGYNEIINNKNGLLFKNKDVNDLTNKLTLLIEDDNLRNNLKKTGYEFSKKYNWKKVSEGIIKIAINSQVPILPIGFASSKNFNLKSWDSFLITYPFSKCKFIWGDPIIIPSSTKDDDLNKYKNLLEEKINNCMDSAEKNLNVQRTIYKILCGIMLGIIKDF